MGNNNSTAQPDLDNITQSDQDIVLLQHLIEVDAVQLQSENKLFVRETLIFRNIGSKNFSGNLRTWVPDGASDIKLAKSEMMTGGGAIPLPFVQNGTIISWGEKLIEKNSPLPFLYVVEYKLSQDSRGTFSNIIRFSKKLAYPTLINYRYTERPGLPAVIVKVTKPKDSSVVFLDENGNKIISSDVTEEDNSVINRFSSPQFKELNMEISKPVAVPAGIGIYLVIGLLIILVLSYPVIRKKSEKLQAIEEKIRNSLKREPQESEETEEEIVEETTPETTAESEVVAEEGSEFLEKTKDELEHNKSEILSNLNELEKDYASGNMLDEEYEELRTSYQAKLKEIDKRLKQL